MGTDVQAPVSGRRLIFIAVLAACVGAFLMLSFIYADHAPEPHGVRIAVVAPPGAAQRVAGGLDRAAPGAFTVTDVASARAARAALRGQKVRGALVLGPGRDAEVLTAGAAGTALSEVIDTALSRAAGAAGRRPSRCRRPTAPVSPPSSSSSACSSRASSARSGSTSSACAAGCGGGSPPRCCTPSSSPCSAPS
jgi:hypothetical protein